MLNPVEEGLIVTDCRLATVDSGVNRGDLVRAVNGRPIGEWVDETARMVSASSDGSRRRKALSRMTATADGSVTLTLERPDGTEATVTPKTVPAFGPPAEPAFAPSRGRGRLSPPSSSENHTPADRSC